VLDLLARFQSSQGVNVTLAMAQSFVYVCQFVELHAASSIKISMRLTISAAVLGSTGSEATRSIASLSPVVLETTSPKQYGIGSEDTLPTSYEFITFALSRILNAVPWSKYGPMTLPG